MEPYVIFKYKIGGGCYRYTLRDTITGKILRIDVSRNPHNPPAQLIAYCQRLNDDYEEHTLEIIAEADRMEARL